MFFNNKSISISSSDIMTIFKKTIQQMMIDIINKSCFSCGSQYNKEDIIKLSCSCLICKICLLKKINQATNNRIILNKYEKSINFEGYCLCVGRFNLQKAIQLIEMPFTEETNQAMNRFTQTVLLSCMACCQNINDLDSIKDTSANVNKREYIQLKISKTIHNNLRPGLDYVDSDHLICLKCINNLGLNNIGNSIKRKGSKLKDKVIEEYSQYCSLCGIDHIIDKNTLYSKKDTIICGHQCLIV